MKNATAILLLLLLTITAKAQSIVGTWYGTINISSVKLNIIYHIQKNGIGFSATMDIPEQGAKGLPMDKVEFSDNIITIEVAQFSMKFKGTFLPDSNKINGTIDQGARSIPLILSPNKIEIVPQKTVARSQDPKDFPYQQEEIKFINTKAGNTLAGTLTMPYDGKASKIVVLITGSGPQDRNEEMKAFNHRPFLVLSDWLTRRGIAVLRYDDRGVGKSTGSAGMNGNATTEDFSDDTEAAVNYIQSRPDLKQLSIGLIGHSEGGMIAPMVASRNPAVKFIVLLAAPGVPISELMLQQTVDQMKLNNLPTDVVKYSTASNKNLYNLIKQHPELSSQQMNDKIDAFLHEDLSAYPKEILGNNSIDDIIKKSAIQTHLPWFHYFLRFTPSDYLKKVTCPVLALNGTLDTQVQEKANLAAIRESLKKGNNKNFQIVPLEGLNHLLQKAQTGAVSEYSQIEETMNPIVLETTANWINKL